VNCLSSIPLRHRRAMAAGVFFVYPAISSAQDTAADSYRELETKYIFGFTEGSDIGPEGERAIEFDSNIAFQRRQGVYNALEQEIEYETNPALDLQIEASAHGVYHQIRGVDGFDDFHGANFGGLSSNFRYNPIERGPGAPVGLTLSVEPEWARINDAGKVSTSFDATAKIIVDTELVPDRLFAAVNAIYDPEIARDFGSPHWARTSTMGLTTALTYRIAPKVTLGGELEYYRANDSFWLDNFAGHALYAGPTLFVQITNKILLAAAFSTQIAGHAAGDPNLLDLTNFSRNKARLLVEIEF
jgi:hypothetical protein